MMTSNKFMVVPVALVLTLACLACDARDHAAAAGATSEPVTGTTSQKRNTMKISLTFQEKTLTGTLYDTPMARDFASMLPLTLTLEDYARSEKISYLPRKLKGEGAPTGTGGSAGGIAYYAPWGNLALFYKDFRPGDELIVIGQLDGGVETLRAPGAVKVTIALVGEDDAKRTDESGQPGER